MSYGTTKPRPANPLEAQAQAQQQAPFSSGAFNQMNDLQATLQSSPETIILECNRLTSRQDDTEAQAHKTNHRWITEFASGIEIKEGDEIRINSAFISSIGVGDLIAWDILEGSQTQDNKANWIISYYVSNDNLNDKRAGYNMETTNNQGGAGKFPYDCDNSAMPLFRVSETISFGTQRTDLVGEGTQAVSYAQDKYLPCRFYGHSFKILCPQIDDHFIFSLRPNTRIVDVNGTQIDVGSSLIVQRVGAGNVISDVDPRNIFGIGQTLYFTPQDEVNLTTPNEYNKPNQKWILTIGDFVYNYLGAEWTMMVDQLGTYFGRVKALTENIQITASVSVAQLPFNTSNNEGYIPISTSILDNFGNNVEIGDNVIQYVDYGITYDDRNYGEIDVGALNDDQTQNENVEAKITESSRPKSATHEPITILTLINPVGASIRERTQEIKFMFNDLQKRASIKTIDALINEIGSNVLIFDIYDNTSDNKREIANVFLIDSAVNNGSSNIGFNGDGSITVDGVKRCINRQQTDVISNGLFCGNIEADNNEDNYIVKSALYFEEMTAVYSHIDEQQFIGISPDYSTYTTTPQTSVGYYSWLVVDDDSLDYSTLQNKNDLNTGGYTFANFFLNDKALNRGMIYQGYEDKSNAGTINVKHYTQFNLGIDENYSSPSDIATALTKQTHETTDIRDSLGNVIGDSKNLTIATNDLFFPVWTTDDDSNTEDGTAFINGAKKIGSFFCKYTMHNSSENICELLKGTNGVYADDGIYEVYFKQKFLSINKPSPSTGSDGTKTFTTDFNQSDGVIPQGNFGASNPNTGVGKTITAKIEYARTYNQNGQTFPQDCIGFPITFAVNPSNNVPCLASQYCGSNNVEFSWDDTNSRFKIDFLHQPAMSKFEATPEGIVQTGDQISTTIYFPSPVGKNGYLYKLPRSRCGGVNIENWTSQFFTNGMTPEAVRKLCNLDDSIDLSTEWFITDQSKVNAPTTNNNYNVVGNRFWNKLGFNNNQIYGNFVGSKTDDITGRYTPLGTTDNLIDIADALITTKEPPENTPFYTTKEDFEGKTDSNSDPIKEEAQYQYSSIGAMEFNNHLTGYGLPNTSGLPLTFRPNFPPDADPTKDEYSAYQSTFNPDRQRNNGYVFTTEGDPLTALDLPIKTEFPYFLVMSDIVKTDFNISANYGSKLNCVGIISKLNAEQDFYFQYQAPQSFYAKKDTIISSITTEIRTPSLSVPPALSPYSSVIYQIVRYSPRPTTLTPPIWFQQQQYFNQMTQLLQNISENVKPAKQSDQQRLQEIMTEIASSVERPDEVNQSSLTQRIISNYDQLNIARFGGNREAIRQFLLTNPDAEPLLKDLNAFRDLPNALQLPTDPESTNVNTLMNSLLQAQPYQLLPADRETEDDYGGMVQVRPPTPPEQRQADNQDVYDYVLRNMDLRKQTDPINQRDMEAIAGDGISPERLAMLNQIAEARTPVIPPQINPDARTLGELRVRPVDDPREDVLNIDPRIALRLRQGGSEGSLVGSMGSDPASRLQELEDEEVAQARYIKRMMGDSSSKASSVPPRYSQGGSKAPSYKTKESSAPSYKTKEDDEDEK